MEAVVQKASIAPDTCNMFMQTVQIVELPRTSRQQARHGAKVSLRKAQPGDLAFFGRGRSISHVGMVVSKPNEPLTVIHASSSKGVMLTQINKSDYWKSRLRHARQVLSDYTSEKYEPEPKKRNKRIRVKRKNAKLNKAKNKAYKKLMKLKRLKGKNNRPKCGYPDCELPGRHKKFHENEGL